MKSSSLLKVFTAMFAVSAWARPFTPLDALRPRMTMYYEKDVSEEVDPQVVPEASDSSEATKRMTMYYEKDVSDEVDPEVEPEVDAPEEVSKRMTMYYEKDVADEVDPETAEELEAVDETTDDA